MATTVLRAAMMIALFALLLGCRDGGANAPPPVAPPASATAPTPVFDASAYQFPAAPDPAQRYLFYLHGKIIEDQGLPAISPEYGEYQYTAILERLSSFGFVVISEPRPRDTDGLAYAAKVRDQVEALIAAGVPPSSISVVGASRGAGITVEISHLLQQPQVNYVILAICHPDVVKEFLQNQTSLSGNVLSIYDSVDGYAGPCQELFAYSEGKGLSRHAEIVLQVGTGHGALYKPLDAWLLPTVAWAAGGSP